MLSVFNKKSELPPSRVYDLLSPLGVEAILLMMAKAKKETTRKHISLYLTHLRTVKVTLSGNDLKKLGIPPGPRYRKILAELLDAKLDGIIKNIDEEIAFAKGRMVK